MNLADKTFRVALKQSAVDSCCSPEDFLKKDNVVVRSEERQGRRAYLSAPYDFDLTSYGGNVVACVREGLEGVARTYLGKYPPAHCFETPALHELDKMLAPFGLKTCFQAEYFLPRRRRALRVSKGLKCGFWSRRDLRIFIFRSGAMRSAPKEGERCAVRCGVRRGNARCSRGCECGLRRDVADRRGRLAAVQRARACQSRDFAPGAGSFARGKVPFYCAAWSNLPSVRNALACGFRPAWVQLTAKSL